MRRLTSFWVMLAVWISLVPGASAGEGRWITSWATAPQSTSVENLPPSPLARNTLRQFLRVSAGGRLVRFRFTNAYSTSPVVIVSARLALSAGQPGSGEIDPATTREFRFDGEPGVVIPPGGMVWSDPLPFELPDLASVGVSLYFDAVSSTVITSHGGSRTTSFIAEGDATRAATLPGAARFDRWYIINGLEVLAPAASSATVAVIGDSITDGRGSTTNGNDRWTDFLAARLDAHAPTKNIGVANLGIGATGVSLALSRFRRDIIEQPGVSSVIIFIGVNDIGGSNAAPASIVANLISAYTTMANQARARGLKVYGATITPFGGSSYYSTDHEIARQDINAWIRTTAVSAGLFDGCFDFDLAVRDPANPVNLLPAYNSDNLHITPAGNAAMAAAVDLSVLIP